MFQLLHKYDEYFEHSLLSKATSCPEKLYSAPKPRIIFLCQEFIKIMQTVPCFGNSQPLFSRIFFYIRNREYRTNCKEDGDISITFNKGLFLNRGISSLWEQNNPLTIAWKNILEKMVGLPQKDL